MTRTCTQVGMCQHRHECDSGCDMFYTHVPVRGPSLAPQHPFAPGELDGPHYKQRNCKHLVRWLIKSMVIILSLALLSGVVRGCIYAATHTSEQQTKKVST